MAKRAFFQFLTAGIYILLMGLLGYLFGLEGFLFLFAIYAPIHLAFLLFTPVLVIFAVRNTIRRKPRNPLPIILSLCVPLFVVIGLDNIFYFYKPLVLPHSLIVKITIAFGVCCSALSATGLIFLSAGKSVSPEQTDSDTNIAE